MARTSRIWPRWEAQKKRLRSVDTFFIDPAEYAKIGEHFTRDQFKKVEQALKAPADYPLLDKMRHAACLYLSVDKEQRALILKGLTGDLHYMPKRKRDKYIKELVSTVQEFSDFLDKRSFHLGQLSSFELIDDCRKFINGLIGLFNRGHELLSARIKPGQKYAEWHIFFYALALIYETVHGKRPAIPRYSDTSRVNPGKLYGDFLDFTQKSLCLIGESVSDEGIRSELRKYYRKRNRIKSDERYAPFLTW